MREHDTPVDMTLLFASNDNGRDPEYWICDLSGGNAAIMTKDQRDRWLEAGLIDWYVSDGTCHYYLPRDGVRPIND